MKGEQWDPRLTNESQGGKVNDPEIKEMEWLIDDIKENGKASNQTEATARPVPEFEGEI